MSFRLAIHRNGPEKEILPVFEGAYLEKDLGVVILDDPLQSILDVIIILVLTHLFKMKSFKGANTGFKEHVALRFQGFENEVLSPFGDFLCSHDPQSNIAVGGSYAKGVEFLRAASDLDMLVFSKVVDAPTKYIIALQELNSLARSFKRKKVVPIFFTRELSEFFFIHIAKQQKTKYPILPCHVLFYKNEEELVQREPWKIASHFLFKTRIIKGLDRGDFSHLKNEQNLGKLCEVEQLYWDVQRAVADLVLNWKLMDHEFLLPYFVDRFTSAFRFYFTSVDKGTDTSAETIAKRLGLDTTCDNALIYMFELRRGTKEFDENIETLLNPATPLLECTKVLKDNCHTTH